MQLVSVFLFFLHLLSPKTNHSQCGVRQYRRDQNPYRNLFKFRVMTWVKVWVRVKQVVIMVMESLQGMNSTLCNVPTSDENEVVCVCVFVQRVCQWKPQFMENQILVGCIDFGTNIYVLMRAQSCCQVCLVCLLALPFPSVESLL